jgi:hypothetical protein
MWISACIISIDLIVVGRRELWDTSLQVFGAFRFYPEHRTFRLVSEHRGSTSRQEIKVWRTLPTVFANNTAGAFRFESETIRNLTSWQV